MPWTIVTRLDALPDGQGRDYDLGGIPVALFRLGDRVCATQALCPHAHAWLANGLIDGTVLRCPAHHARFDLLTGRALSDLPGADLRLYPVRVVDGMVLVEIG